VNSKNILWISFVVVASIVFYLGTSKFLERALESEIKLGFRAFQIAQNSYFDEYHEFGESGKEIGFHFVDEGKYKYYFNEKQVPGTLLGLIPKSALPFVQSDSYRVLHELRKGDGELIGIWILNSDGKMYRIVNKELVFKADVGKK